MAEFLNEEGLDKLKQLVEPFKGTQARVGIQGDLVWRMIEKIEKLEAEIFRLRVCGTVDQIIDDDEFNRSSRTQS